MRLLLGCLGSLLLAMVAVASPNVVLIYTDDLGYGDLGVMGHPVIRTPHLDRLAGESLLLTNYHAPSPLCSPSRAALLTGRMPYRTGIKSWIPAGTGIYLRTAETTLAEVLKARGYATALIGKWHLNSALGDPREPQPRDHGFDYAYGNNAFQIPTNENPTNLYRNGEALGRVEGYTAQLYVDEATAWISARQRENDRPFFLYLAMNEPHTTIANPPEYNAMYSGYTRGEIVPIPSGEAEIPRAKLVARGPGEYYANITYLDAQLGRLLDALDRQGLRENTLVVFTSDNGPVTGDWRQWHEVNAHGSTGGFRGRKHLLYQGGLRVPALLRLPGVVRPGTSDAFVVGTDLFPTIARLCGAEVPDDRAIDGIDLAPLLVGGALEREQGTLWALPMSDGKEFAYREGDWKLLLAPDQTALELYDLASDPLELLECSRAHPERVEAMSRAFREAYAAVLADPLRPAGR